MDIVAHDVDLVSDLFDTDIFFDFSSSVVSPDPVPRSERQPVHRAADTDERDVSAATRTLQTFSPFCRACGTTETPQWRYFNDNMVCNSCGLKYAHNRFCTVCRRPFQNGERNYVHCGYADCRKPTHIFCDAQAIVMAGAANCLYVCVECRSRGKWV